MPKVVTTPPSVTAAQGFKAAGVCCGIKPSGKPDLALIVADEVCSAAGVFTTSRFPGEPVKVTRSHLERTGGRARAIVCNSGISNVATGDAGFAHAVTMCQEVAKHIGCMPEEVLVASTGVIGEPLPIDKIVVGIAQAAQSLDRGEAADAAAAEAIMTTDLVPKHAISEVEGGGTVGGIAKGAGMIAPNMATMLAFLTTDVRPPVDALQAGLREAAGETFNRLSIDSDTSTSDMVLCLASGNNPPEAGDHTRLFESLVETSDALSTALAWDGEGVTRLIRLHIDGAYDAAEADKIARSVIDSPLVKCAVHGGDPNWGRLVMAIGKSGVQLNPNEVWISIGDGDSVVGLLDRGRPFVHSEAEVAQLHTAMQADEVWITIGLGRGSFSGTWTGVDLSREYIRINADYTT